VVRLVWPNYPESYASDSIATGFASYAGHVEGDELTHKKKTLKRLRQRKHLFDFWSGHTDQHFIKSPCHSWFLDILIKKSCFPIISDLVLCTEFGSLTSTCRHDVSFFFPPPIGSPWFQAQWLGQLAGSLGRWNSVQSGITQRSISRHVSWETVRHHSGGFGSYPFQDLPAWWSAVPDTRSYSVWNTPEESAKAAVAYHQWPRAESWG